MSWDRIPGWISVIRFIKGNCFLVFSIANKKQYHSDTWSFVWKIFSLFWQPTAFFYCVQDSGFSHWVVLIVDFYPFFLAVSNKFLFENMYSSAKNYLEWFLMIFLPQFSSLTFLCDLNYLGVRTLDWFFNVLYFYFYSFSIWKFLNIFPLFYIFPHITFHLFLCYYIFPKSFPFFFFTFYVFRCFLWMHIFLSYIS